MNSLYVFQPNGQPTGPFTSEALAKAIVDGALPRDAFVAPVGSAQWLHASQVPEVNAYVEAIVRARSTPPPAPASTRPASMPPPIPAAARVPVEARPVEARPAEARPAEAKPVDVKPADAKPAEEKAKPKPWPKWLPAVIFGAFAALTLVEVAVGVLVPPKTATTEELPPAK